MSENFPFHMKADAVFWLFRPCSEYTKLYIATSLYFRMSIETDLVEMLFDFDPEHKFVIRILVFLGMKK